MKPKNLHLHGFWLYLLLLNLSCHCYGSKVTDVLVNDETLNSLLHNKSDASDDRYFDSKKEAKPSFDTFPANITKVYASEEDDPIKTDESLESNDKLIRIESLSLPPTIQSFNIDDKKSNSTVKTRCFVKHGNAFPTDENGNFMVIVGENIPEIRIIPTDSSGKPIYPVLRSDGLFLPTDSSGYYVNKKGETIKTNENGLPLGPDGQVLPTDWMEYHFYPEPTTTSSSSDINGIKSESYKSPFPTPSTYYICIGGTFPTTLIPYPTDETGKFFDFDGSPLPTNQYGKFIGLNGSPLPTDDDGNIFTGYKQPLVTLSPTNPSKIDPTDQKSFSPDVTAGPILKPLSEDNQSDSDKIRVKKHAQEPVNSFLKFFYNIHI